MKKIEKVSRRFAHGTLNPTTVNGTEMTNLIEMYEISFIGLPLKKELVTRSCRHFLRAVT